MVVKTTFNRMSAMNEAQRTALGEQFTKASRLSTAEPIAVIGVGCRLPGGVDGPDSYWKFLTEGRDGIVGVPADRWDAEEYYDPDLSVPGRMPSKWGGFLSDISGFDADFFGITPREAEAMDPQQRLLLEVAWEALENAGYAPEAVNGVRGAVMAGVYYNEYQTRSAADPDSIDAYSATGNAHSVTVGRIAYLLGLRGPAVAVDTACSSSLVSVHMACQSLRTRESDLALAGGVNLILRPETQLALAKWGMLSPRGHCYAFDAGADGFVRGEGAGVVVLKRLSDAIADGDRVVAVVRGSAVNQDGRSNGLTAPNAPAQVDVIRRALTAGDVPAGTVNFIETHGTGTALGDPIEFDALASVYGKGETKCALGAVKSNFGHLEGAAGIAGFIKAVLTVQRGTVPPNLNFSQWNPAIDPKQTRLFVPTESQEWPSTGVPRRAGVSGFGLGGTNAHIILEQGLDPAAPSAVDGVSTLSVSGKTAPRVQAWAATLADWLEGEGAASSVADVAHSLRRRRGPADVVGTVSARSTADAIAGLRALAAGNPAAGVVAPRALQSGPGTVFCFSGQGSQWAGMGQRLLATEPAFAAAIDEIEPDFVAAAGFSLKETLLSGETVVGIDRIQPVLTGIQLALTDLWRSYGITPDAVIGHSMGEVAASVVSGALSRADGLTVISTRSRLMKRLSGQGAMALLEADASAAESLVAGYDNVGVAVHASPKHTVVAGPPEQIDALIAEVTKRNLLARRVEVDVASHHPTVDPILDELRTELAGLRPQQPTIPLFTTVDPDGGTPTMGPDYWVNNLRQPVRFNQAVARAAASHATFLEMSPHPLLTYSITECLDVARPRGDVLVSGTIVRDEDEGLGFHANLAAVDAARSDISLPEQGRLTDLPPAAWQHESFWITVRAGATVGAAAGHPLLGTHVELPTGGHVWQAEVGTDTLPWLADHRVHGQAIMPAAGFAEIALAAGSSALSVPVESIVLSRLEVDQMLPVEGTVRLTTSLTVDGDETRVEVNSRADDGAWRRHAVARIEKAGDEPPRRSPSAAGGDAVSPSDFYTALRRTGAHHAQAFAALVRIVRTGTGASESEIVLPDEATINRELRLHPVMLDAALQGVAAAMPTDPQSEQADATYLPVAIDSLRVRGPIGRQARCFAEVLPVADSADKVGNFTLLDDAGTVIVEASGVYLRRVQRHTVPLPLSQKVFGSSWVQTEVAAGSSAPKGSWLVLSGDGAQALADDFTTAFAGADRRIVRAELGNEPGLAQAFADAASDPDLPPVGVVVVLGKDAFDGTEASIRRAEHLVWSVSATVRTIASGWHGVAPRLWVATRNGLTLDDREGGDPTVGALKGLVRVLAYEHPDLKATLVDLDDSGDARAALVAELEASGNDDVVAFRDGQRYAERLARVPLGEPTREESVRGDGAYVITGGMGGLGLVMARWLIDAGAGRIVLNGRSELTPEQQSELDALSDTTAVAYVAGDISAPGVAQQLVTAAESTGQTLRGVLHSAAVIDDALIVALGRDSLERVWAPKVSGALALHTATTGRDLDFWIVFSSVASLLGSPGQGAYAAANAWVDALVAWRRAAGLPATSVNWGQWAQVGVAQSLSMDAIDPIAPAEGIEALEALQRRDLAQVGVVRLRLDRAAAAFPELGQIGYFSELVAELDGTQAEDDWAGPEALKDLDPATVLEVVSDRLRSRIAAIMGYADASAIDAEKPLTDLGMDSLMAVRIRNTVRGDFGVEPPVALLLQGANPTALAAELISQLGLASAEPTEPGDDLRDRASRRAAARQRAARRRTGQRA